MSHWNYRLTVTRKDGEQIWAIRELYYDDQNLVVGWSELPDHPQGETPDEFRKDLKHYVEALEHPAFDIDNQRWLGHDISEPREDTT